MIRNAIKRAIVLDSVSTYLRDLFPGVPLIETAMGETEPFIDTGNGVREQLNRRG